MLNRALLPALWIAVLATPAFANEVNVYSYREQKLIQPLFEAFTKDSGIKVNVISASSGLEQRIKTEGANSPADVLLSVDVARLHHAADPVRAAREGGAEGLSRSGRRLVRHLDARARGLCLEGTGEAGRDHL
jgi:ABC-type thiamine transport system substrate-binding protein